MLTQAKRDYIREYMRRRRATRPDVREYERRKTREAYQADPEAARARHRQWARSHPESVKATRDKCRKPDVARAYNVAYYSANAERERERARERRRTHPEDKRLSQRKRKAMRAATPYTLTRQQIEAILSRGCAFCGTSEYPTLAHDIPVSRGGGTTPDNTFCLCRNCNSRMHTRTLAEWRMANG